MAEESFRVVVQKEQLTFSAAHFITFGNNICERLHGHNYGVRCEVSGPLNEHGYVVDFIALRDRLAEIALTMDHRVLLPTQHPSIKVRMDDGEVTARFEERRWVFPAADCLLLPVRNTTAELLAEYVADQLIENLDSWGQPTVEKIRVGIDENQGQWGECTIALPR